MIGPELIFLDEKDRQQFLFTLAKLAARPAAVDSRGQMIFVADAHRDKIGALLSMRMKS